VHSPRGLLDGPITAIIAVIIALTNMLAKPR
jgi:hypothetical protein